MLMILTLVLLGAAVQDSLLGTHVEGIAAVVGGELILRSDVEGLVEWELQQKRISSPDDLTLGAMRKEMLDQLIDDRLLLNYARQETITVTVEETETSLQQRIDAIRARFPSESSFIAQLEAEGLDMPRFREVQRRMIEEQLIKGKLQEKLRSEWRIQVTEFDVKRFCEQRADEIPETPSRVQLHHILLKAGPPPGLLAAQDSLLRSLRERTLAGESFEDLARRFSEDASAALGGDLGVFTKGTMVAEFEAALEKLHPGEISGVVETRFGLHLIQLVEREGDRFRARHIIRLLPEADDSGALDSSVQEIIAQSGNATFGELAERYSADVATKDKEGLLGTLVPSALQATPLRALLDTLPEKTISPPIADQEGVHLYWIESRIPAGKPSCDEIASGIRDLLLSEKLEARLAQFIADLRAETYVEIFR